ncbi:MAG TPA: cell cycle transcriptional regulator TrcR [Kiloniellales bacterium]
MAHPLMPKATAVWLIENTSLTFEQVADFCGLHPLEVQGIADDEVSTGIQGLDPIIRNQVTREEIERCQKDPAARLNMAKQDLPQPAKRTKGPRYTPVAKRQDKPDGIAWLARHHPELKDSQIARLIGTTKTTIQAVRERTHWNSPNIRPRDPVLLGLCSQGDLNQAVEKARRAAARAGITLPSQSAAEPEREPAAEHNPYVLPSK